MSTIISRHPKSWCQENYGRSTVQYLWLHRVLSLRACKSRIHLLTIAMESEMTLEEKLRLDHYDLANTAMGASNLSLHAEGFYCPSLSSNHPFPNPATQCLSTSLQTFNFASKGLVFLKIEVFVLNFS